MAQLEPRKYSERLGVIDPGQLQDVCDEFRLGRLIDTDTPIGGLFGQNIFLSTSEGEYVFRGNPHGHVQLTKERVVAKLISERSTLPAPWPYEISENAERFGWTYAVMPRLDGVDGGRLRDVLDDDGKLDLAAAHGEALARLHETTSEFFGPYDPQVDGFIAMDDFPDWLLHRLQQWRDDCRAVNALSTDAERYIDDTIERCAPALSVPFTPVLVHHDFKPGNLNFDPATLDPTGVFDLMEAYFADGEEDIVRMLWSVGAGERDAFVEQYVVDMPFRDGASDRLELYALSDWLVIWGYGHRHGAWFENTTFMETITPIAQNARKVGS